MHSIPSSTTGARRSSWLLSAALLLTLSACGADPVGSSGAAAPADPAPPAAPADPAAPPGAAPVVPDARSASSRQFRCVTTRRTTAKMEVTGFLEGDVPDHVDLALVSSGASLASVKEPGADAGFDGGVWASAWGYTPWILGEDPAAPYRLILPPAPGSAFSASLGWTGPSGAAVTSPMACTAWVNVVPAAPPDGAAGPVASRFRCSSPGSTAAEAVAVSGAFDAAGRARDLVVSRASTGEVVAQAAAPSYQAGFDGGAWARTGLFAWLVTDAGTAGSQYLLLPGLPRPRMFDAYAVTDYGAAGRVMVPVVCVP